jgi:hypothetical protein
MNVVTPIVAVAALVIAVIAFQRTGGIKDLWHQVEVLSSKSKAVRNRTADVLARFERLIRGRENPASEP